MIERAMTIEEIFTKFPAKSQKLSHEMTSAGLHCVGCGAAVWETLEAGMLKHGFSDAAVDEMIHKLNAILQEEDATDTIKLTQRAATKFNEILETEKKAGYGLRFGDKPGGCGGFEYVLDFSQAPDEDDEIFISEGVQIFVKKAMLSRLLGSTIDYADGLMSGGFKVSNPNVKNSCSCGSSQGY
ncbi:MAG: iron-sulfur cluster assembly accessory protein [Chlamydiales bacterium]|nr:iron-sulfur cluster assembly accessory protein [Chlamydiales bacterium]